MTLQNSLNEIPVVSVSDTSGPPATGNDVPILNEIRHALKRLLDSGEVTVIDLKAIPMAPGEEERIERILGLGEVVVNINALGPSTVIETTFPGVWLVTHQNATNDVVGKYIEVTHCPAIVGSQAEDMRGGFSNICKVLEELTQTSGGSGDEI